MVINMKKTNAMILSLMLTAVLGLVSGCGNGETAKDETAEAGTLTETEAASEAAQGSSAFTGELEQNVTIRVLENDTAIARGYAKELLEAFNEAYAEYGITAVDANMDQYLDLANDGPYGYGPDVLYQANDVINMHRASMSIRSRCRIWNVMSRCRRPRGMHIRLRWTEQLITAEYR